MRSKVTIQLIDFLKKIPLLLTSCLVFAACSKPDEIIIPEQQVVQYLTGSGNRYWHIKEIYVNGIKTSLTTSQLAYTKTYTYYAGNDVYSGRFTDADNLIGKWELKGTDHILETTTNVPSGPVLLDLTINFIDANNMDVQYKFNTQTVRSVYFAY